MFGLFGEINILILSQDWQSDLILLYLMVATNLTDPVLFCFLKSIKMDFSELEMDFTTLLLEEVHHAVGIARSNLFVWAFGSSANFNMHSNEPISHFKFKFFSLCHILLNLSRKELNISYRCKKSNLEKSLRMSTKLRMFLA